MIYLKNLFVKSPLEKHRFQWFFISFKNKRVKKNPKPFQPAVKKKRKAISAQQSAFRDGRERAMKGGHVWNSSFSLHLRRLQSCSPWQGYRGFGSSRRLPSSHLHLRSGAVKPCQITMAGFCADVSNCSGDKTIPNRA